ESRIISPADAAEHASSPCARAAQGSSTKRNCARYSTKPKRASSPAIGCRNGAWACRCCIGFAAPPPTAKWKRREKPGARNLASDSSRAHTKGHRNDCPIHPNTGHGRDATDLFGYVGQSGQLRFVAGPSGGL